MVGRRRSYRRHINVDKEPDQKKIKLEKSSDNKGDDESVLVDEHHTVILDDSQAIDEKLNELGQDIAVEEDDEEKDNEKKDDHDLDTVSAVQSSKAIENESELSVEVIADEVDATSNNEQQIIDDQADSDQDIDNNAADDQDEELSEQEDVTNEDIQETSTGEAIESIPVPQVTAEVGNGITKFKFDGIEYKFKERPSVLEEKEGKIEFRVVNNDNTKENMMVLTGLKNIFQKQLPKMPKEYIARLVYDRSHLSMAVVRKPLTVVGGITYRPFDKREFAEIVFCAISSTEQVRGYGAHLMNHLKDYVRNASPIKYFLTYADNYAIGYFKKQGFTKEITLDNKVWMGYIKDYEGGTLMQCTMLPCIRYLDAPKILLLQEAALMRKIRTISKSHIVRSGLEQFRDLESIKPIDPMTIPGLKEAGWTPEMDELAQRPKRGPHYAAMTNILTELQNHASAWPFLQPVNREEVPDYYEFIKEPMDLSTMEIKLENNRYEKMEDFVYDSRLVFDNCRKYNGENTSYFKYANRLEKFFNGKVKEVPEYSHLVN